jgi:hypothetical protein
MKGRSGSSRSSSHTRRLPSHGRPASPVHSRDEQHDRRVNNNTTAAHLDDRVELAGALARHGRSVAIVAVDLVLDDPVNASPKRLSNQKKMHSCMDNAKSNAFHLLRYSSSISLNSHDAILGLLVVLEDTVASLAPLCPSNATIQIFSFSTQRTHERCGSSYHQRTQRESDW